MMLLAARLRLLRWDVTHSFAFQIAFTVFITALLCAVAQFNMFTCRPEAVLETSCTFMSGTTSAASNGSTTPVPPVLSTFRFASDDHRSCPLPHYILLSGVLGFPCVAIFLRLPAVVKAVVHSLVSTVFLLLFPLTHRSIMDCYDIRAIAMMMKMQMHHFSFDPYGNSVMASLYGGVITRLAFVHQLRQVNSKFFILIFVINLFYF